MIFRPLLLGCVLSLSACQPSPSGTDDNTAGTASSIRGQATYLERLALPAGSTLSVQLLDNRLADTPKAVIARGDFKNLQAPPFAFNLPFNPARLRVNGSYGLHASLRDAQGQLLFVTDTRIPVTPGSAAEVQFRMVRVAAHAVADATPARPSVPPSPWEQAKAQGVTFRGIGTEPGWLVEVGTGDLPSLHADLDYGQRQIEVEQLKPEAHGYRGTSRDGLTVQLDIRQQACNDGMSDENYPAQIVLTVTGKRYQGCGRYLKD